ncbi:MAG: sensor domain-containing diguanylate cyclase [Smithellaceae bacterium]|jgi:diguanylate cyclase (GGDEF)-like protein/PAS domain S-box-containing protein|nr:sensor domain-containing diguanylate cyclase [Smithellaceae bacterium]MDD3259862.1 sensor domain-containing diguanylate cyclase [Smithellaceae bacterium]MDD3849616.1 sensor domain-containing diguanylate cyclase [Smithellaceae bacterium]HOG12566.1 sensor domain-containing diguanylate cyclase [Smithellaceae bacterium]HOQ72406.1 sensor domain-containing diguanylate cyclase [Smithellaceae bacterium]
MPRNGSFEIQCSLEKALAENRNLKLQFDATVRQVHELNSFIRLLLNMSPFGICIVQGGRLIFSNKTFCDICGCSSSELRGIDPLPMVFPEDRDHVQNSVRSSLEEQVDSFFIFRVLTRKDAIKWILGSVNVIHMNGKRAFLGNFVDLTEGRVMQLAYSDPLTGLPNRKLMWDRLEQAMVSAKRRSCRLALLFVDLDKFKDINDAYGHKTGDQLLAQVADRLRSAVRRENDTLARIGGDEFLILLTDVSQRTDIENFIRLLFEKFRPCLQVGSPPLEVQVGFSVGVALYPEHGESADVLIHHADLAMYQVKKARGEEKFCFFDAQSPTA